MRTWVAIRGTVKVEQRTCDLCGEVDPDWTSDTTAPWDACNGCLWEAIRTLVRGPWRWRGRDRVAVVWGRHARLWTKRAG